MFVGQLSQKILLLAAGLLLALPLHAGDIPRPEVPRAKARATQEYGCVRPVADMRKNHMKYLKFHRDETLREGIRTTRDSLKECVNCHVTETTPGTYPVYGSEKHFCSSCHHYAAVEIDCFGCHRDKPAESATARPVLEHQAGLTFNQAAPDTEAVEAGTAGGASHE